MNAAKYEKWESFYRLAMSHFKHLGQPGDIEYIVEPVSEQIEAVKIYRALDQQVMIEKMTWDSGLDFEKFQQANIDHQRLLNEFKPTIFTKAYPIDAGDASELAQLSQGFAFTLPVSPNPGFVILDGTRYELRLHHYSGKIDLAWHSELPEEWYAVRPLLDKLEDLKMHFFTESTKK
ncbi:MAG TPA: hypothetical protein DCS93_36275 [Microscillaceae bacterium]|nr:hypothetical protein [Microscillaceae bacterium]